ncbi:MAG: hypothetical protein QNJ62_01460 [Methyloceanibacter sp.]|nr:hypothetical protein [Methyloceanibacter sp.]
MGSRILRRRVVPATCMLGLGALLGLGLFVFSCADTLAAPDAVATEETRAKAAAKPDVATPDKSTESKLPDKSPDKSWSAHRNDSKITLRGVVPSEEDRQTSLGMVKAHFPDLAIDDKVIIAETSQPREQWLAAVSFGLQQLSHMSKGKVRLDGSALTVAGRAVNAEEYGKLKKALTGTLPGELTLRSVGVRPPVADPFVFQADLGPNALRLAGSVPSEGARKTVRDLSRQLFARPGLDDRLEVASGAPKNWDKAVAAALRALSRLETGKVALSGVDVSIEGVAPDQGTAVAVSYQLKRDLPERFSTSERIKWKEAALQLDLGSEPGAAQDVAATIIPRIKVPAEPGGRWRSGSLPPLIPLGATSR